jgi:hypothetical protein
MNPDLITIARRRHLMTIMLRVAVLVWVAYSVWHAVDGLLGNISGFVMAGIGGLVYELVLPLMGRLFLAAALVFLEKPLVRWLVPASAGGENTCPKCGYSLKNLKSPVCPECGMNLR